MPEFMDVHTNMPGVTSEALMEAHQADLDIQDDEGVGFKHAWADPKPATCSACPRVRTPRRSGDPRAHRAPGGRDPRDHRHGLSGTRHCARRGGGHGLAPVDQEARQRFARARVARLATVRPDGGPHLVPIVFVLVDDVVWSAVDGKPKSTRALRRLANIRSDPGSACSSTTTATTGRSCGGSAWTAWPTSWTSTRRRTATPTRLSTPPRLGRPWRR